MEQKQLLARRLCRILVRLYQGECLDSKELAAEFNVSLRTIQRDFKERLTFLPWSTFGGRYYQIDTSKLQIITKKDIEKFVLLSNIEELFPDIEKCCFKDSWGDSITVKGFSYETIRKKSNTFLSLKNAINLKKKVSFKYQKNSSTTTKFYQIDPYRLVNKKGIWYLMGANSFPPYELKTFCFTQITDLRIINEIYVENEDYKAFIDKSDSIFTYDLVNDVELQVDVSVAKFFTRRNLLPNQELKKTLENGDLIIQCNYVHEKDILPIVQCWLPHVKILKPLEWQKKLTNKVKEFLKIMNN